jgi:hypothetical protein
MSKNNPNIPDIHIALEFGKHKKGEPYPEYDFSYLIKHKITNSSGVVACSNEEIVHQINHFYENNPDKTEATYFFYREETKRN